LRSGRVQYIFMDRSIQKLLYSYALTQGWDRQTLDALFANCQGAVFQHVRGHRNHMHVRFYTPWSTLAGAVRGADPHKMAVIELAQQAFLPKKVHYEVSGNEQGLDALAKSFGVSREELLRWNGVHQTAALAPGSRLVFYKRGFETEPVNLAQTLQPALASFGQPPQQFAALDSLPNLRLRGDSQHTDPALLHGEEEDGEDDLGAAQAAPTVRGASSRGGLTLAALSKSRTDAGGAPSKAALKGKDARKNTKAVKGKNGKQSPKAVAKGKTRPGDGRQALKKSPASSGKDASKGAVKKASSGKKPEKTAQTTGKKSAPGKAPPSKKAAPDTTASGKKAPDGPVTVAKAP